MKEYNWQVLFPNREKYMRGFKKAWETSLLQSLKNKKSVIHAFIWDCTIQGEKFWDEVYEGLHEREAHAILVQFIHGGEAGLPKLEDVL